MIDENRAGWISDQCARCRPEQSLSKPAATVGAYDERSDLPIGDFDPQYVCRIDARGDGIRLGFITVAPEVADCTAGPSCRLFAIGIDRCDTNMVVSSEPSSANS